MGSIFVGFLFKDILIGQNSTNFWKSSILFLKDIDLSYIQTWLLLITPIIVVLSIPAAFYLFIKNKIILDNARLKNEKIYKFLLNKWYFDEMYEKVIINSSKKVGIFLWKFLDLRIIDGFGPDGVSRIIKKLSIKANKFQSGYIYHYAFIMLLGFSALLTLLIIK